MNNSETSIFDEPSDTDEMVFMTRENKDELLGRFVKPYPFPAEEGRSAEGFYVRMATVAILKKYEDLKSHKSSSDTQRFKAMCDLIADGVCDSSGEVIWSADEVKSMSQANVPRFNRMMYAVLDRNGMASLEKLIEEAEKN